MKTRTPRIAGSWYPDSAEEIMMLIGDGVAAAKKLEHPAAIVVPHAGYAYSGSIAAQAFAGLKAEDYDRVIVLAPSHRVAMRRSFSVEPAAGVKTPFGVVELSPGLHDELAALPGSRYVPEAHPWEHAIDIELPLIKRFLPNCQVGAAIVGVWDARNPADAKLLQAFGAAFGRMLDRRTLVVISTDFTHYGEDFGYVPFREDVAERLRALDAEMFVELAKNNGLAWSEALARTGATICGASALQLLLAGLPESARFERLAYGSSGDMTGDWSHVVGYTAAAVYADWGERAEPAPEAKKKTEAETGTALSDEAGAVLVGIARQRLEQAVGGAEEKAPVEMTAAVRQELQRRCGAFVTLTEQGELRGCIGMIVSEEPVEEVVREMAVAAALEDPRFPAVRAEELPGIEIEVSVLSEPQAIAGPEEIVIGRDGVILSKRGRRAVFLPQVAPEQGWNVPTMLTHLALKAGLRPNDWQEGAQFETFRAQIFHEK